MYSTVFLATLLQNSNRKTNKKNLNSRNSYVFSSFFVLNNCFSSQLFLSIVELFNPPLMLQVKSTCFKV